LVVNRELLGMWWRAKASWRRNSIELQADGAHPRLNFTHLLAFFEVARSGGVSAGAERLRVSQPAVAREIKELEDRLGLMLFDWLPRGVALTDAGSMLLRYAEQIFSLADAAESESRELAGLSAGRA
jgi:DNA-binding transcriptional LysR family regulator